ncbi:hypothetical protein NW768_011078 [Fusarium equiseti]|uniref:Uncharacterized protein n=1 Tax=Fusarium equiseti TaxID=61235 RepID=A0ABQ8QYG1_FUSEQ|nr:hypothetical protein NW768_011078 [Fusarium equiseti]
MPTIDHSSNPWLQIYIPLAFGSPPKDCQIALRHTLISVAAYQRGFREGHSRQQDMHTGFEHEKLALQMLKQAIESQQLRSQTLKQKCTALAAALGMISINVFGPHASDCGVHLNLAERIIDTCKSEESVRPSSLTGILYQIFRCYEMVANTARLTARTPTIPWGTPGHDEASSTPTHPEHLDQCDVHDDDDDGPGAGFAGYRPFVLNSSFGISQRTMSLLQQTIKYSSICSNKIVPMSNHTVQQIRILYHKLCDVEVNPLNFLSPVSAGVIAGCLDACFLHSECVDDTGITLLPKVISDELVENHQLAFHHAVIIYFHQVIPEAYLADKGSDRDFASVIIHKRNTCQSLVRKVWDHLENIDCLTPPDIQFHRGNVLWPAFIAAVESIQIELRHRALIWFHKAAKKGVGNTLRAKELVMEVWRRVDRQIDRDSEPVDLGPVDWRVVMNETGQSFMLT